MVQLSGILQKILYSLEKKGLDEVKQLAYDHIFSD